MTDMPDTSTDAVNKVLAELTGFTACDPYCHGRCSVCPDDAVSRAATTLRALAAERDALRQSVEQARWKALEEAARIADIEPEYPTAMEQMTPVLAAKIADHPVVAIQSAAALTKRAIAAAIRTRINF